jgi:hypothetical protein
MNLKLKDIKKGQEFCECERGKNIEMVALEDAHRITNESQNKDGWLGSFAGEVKPSPHSTPSRIRDSWRGAIDPFENPIKYTSTQPMNIQDWMDDMSKQWKHERAETQMTLGELIDHLKALPPEYTVQELKEPRSYRGYYSDLAFEHPQGTTTAAKALEVAYSALGETFQGYKGGDSTMDRNTPIWFASYGDCGVKIIALNENGTFATKQDE